MSVGGRQKLPQKLSGLPRDLAELFEGKGEGETERERDCTVDAHYSNVCWDAVFTMWPSL